MSTAPILLEVIATTLSDAQAAARAGADRIELATGLSEGGLTPSIGLIEAVTAALPIPVNVIVRSHGRGFVYTPEEMAILERDTRAAVAAGAAGIVFGALNGHGDVDTAALARIADAAGGKPITFHRAFDVSRDLNAAFDLLLNTPAVRTVLTSGGHPSALDGRETIARLVRRAQGSACQVLAGAGLKVESIGDFVRATGVRAVHLGSGVRERGEVWGPVEGRLVAKVRATLDAVR
ncbi:copper homeostasis protein CutC [Burkholderia perseverans]|uniref:copper homeostasis protein CutC n=1 Tax=Burkholderia perseverans TaxID=2615214 RepID=UPI001FEEB60B|nr:copper homeostasis protein CutC [Burkholderia perseverans]